MQQSTKLGYRLLHSVRIMLHDIRGHSKQALNQPLTAMWSNHKLRSSNWLCNDISIVNPFSRLWIFSPSSWLRITKDLKLLIIAQTFPAYFFCNTLNDIADDKWKLAYLLFGWIIRIKPPVGWRGKDVAEISFGTSWRVCMQVVSLLVCIIHAGEARRVGPTSHDASVFITP